MEIVSISYIDNQKYENKLNINDNSINSIIDYGNIKSLVVKGRNYILLDDIICSFKTNTLGEEINRYEKNLTSDYIENLKKLFDFNEDFYNKDKSIMSSSEIRLCYIFINLLLDNDLIILDDLTESLDSQNINKILFILRELKKQGKTIIIISNDVEMIHKISDNIIVINKQIICYGSKYDVFVNNDLSKIPNVIRFSKIVKDKKNVKLGYRDDIKDLMKDIYRCAK
ncbi:MAG: hypothetical protein NC181_00095 [Clostridium sp.]|nr:hypothetical protein [Clostridium sp.]MCM1443924.1 hypothetical protein [Candidatus Amulumruptor caecigallinarius]